MSLRRRQSSEATSASDSEENVESGDDSDISDEEDNEMDVVDGVSCNDLEHDDDSELNGRTSKDTKLVCRQCVYLFCESLPL